MRSLSMCLAIVLGLAVTTAGCSDDPTPDDWGPQCQRLADVYNDCIPNFCELRETCEMCQCWRDGYPNYTAAGCGAPDEGMCQGAADWVVANGCDGIQSSYTAMCEQT